MAGDSFQTVKVGDQFRFPAALYNALISELKEAKSRNRFGTDLGGVPLTSRIWLQNDTGVDFERWNAIGVGDIIYTESDNPTEFYNSRFSFTAEELEVPKHHDNVAITLEPIPNGRLGQALIAGICPAYVYIRDQEHQFAEIIDTNYTCEDPEAENEGTVLATDHGGSFKILWKDPDVVAPDYGWAVVAFPKSVNQLYRATTNANQSEFTIDGKPCYRDGAMAAAPGADDDTYTFPVACLEVTCANCAHRCADFTTMTVTVSGFEDRTGDSPTPGSDCTAYNGVYVLTKDPEADECGFSSENDGGSVPVGSGATMTIVCDDTDEENHVWRLQINDGDAGEGTASIGELICGQGTYSLTGGSTCYEGGSGTSPQSATAVAELS